MTWRPSSPASNTSWISGSANWKARCTRSGWRTAGWSGPRNGKRWTGCSACTNRALLAQSAPNMLTPFLGGGVETVGEYGVGECQPQHKPDQQAQDEFAHSSLPPGVPGQA